MEEKLKGYSMIQITMPNSSRLATDDEVDKILLEFFDTPPTSDEKETKKDKELGLFELKVRTGNTVKLILG